MCCTMRLRLVQNGIDSVDHTHAEVHTYRNSFTSGFWVGHTVSRYYLCIVTIGSEKNPRCGKDEKKLSYVPLILYFILMSS